jgi:uncharacterized membrane protein YeaQ/YmgE (transglycosylase-associated protein family)
MDFIGWLVAGLIIGALAKLVMPGDDPGGIIVTILLGIVGAMIAGGLGRAFGMYAPGQPAGWIMSILGAVLVLFVYRQAVAHRGPRVRV